MKYPKKVEVLGRMLYLIGKQGISYRGTLERAANSDTLWNPGNFLAIFLQVTHSYLLLYETLLQRDFSYMSPSSKNELIVCKINHSNMTYRILSLVTKSVLYMCMCVCVHSHVYIYIYIIYIYIYIYILYLYI